jgi:Polyketide cyclase / dehydrase and lipid transport
MPKSYASTVINAPTDTVWAYVRDFSNLDEWQPAIESCEIEGGARPDQVGAIRRLTAQGGQATFRERLIAFDDEGRSLTYEFVESPLPVRDYRSTIRVAPVTNTGQTFVEWWGEFAADDKDAEPMTKFFAKDVYGDGLDSLRDRYA